VNYYYFKKKNSMSFQCCSCCNDVWIPVVTDEAIGLGQQQMTISRAQEPNKYFTVTYLSCLRL
jgi:hypothetical protein